MANILIIGAGKMGSALVTSWAKLGEHALAVVEPDELLNTTASRFAPRSEDRRAPGRPLV